jgi:hypothetical protein
LHSIFYKFFFYFHFDATECHLIKLVTCWFLTSFIATAIVCERFTLRREVFSFQNESNNHQFTFIEQNSLLVCSFNIKTLFLYAKIIMIRIKSFYLMAQLERKLNGTENLTFRKICWNISLNIHLFTLLLLSIFNEF